MLLHKRANHGSVCTFTNLAWKPAKDGKYEFVFMDSFNEMLEDFRQYQPELLKDGKKIPLDWTLYYLRKKALTRRITNEELAWLLLNFNQKRGYYQLRGEEEEETSNQLVEYYSLRVVDVEDSGDKKGEDVWYNVQVRAFGIRNDFRYGGKNNLPDRFQIVFCQNVFKVHLFVPFSCVRNTILATLRCAFCETPDRLCAGRSIVFVQPAFLLRLNSCRRIALVVARAWA